jgi:hypothetical protein
MPSFIESPSYSGAAPTNTIVYTDAGEVFAAGNIQTDGTALAPTVISNTVKAATVGNVGAAHVGSTGTFSGTVIAATLNAATIGNASATHIGASATLTGTAIAATVNAATIGNSGATLTGTVSTASQPNITTLAGVTSIGATGVETSIVGNLTVGGNLSVTGNSVSIGASTLSITDPVINLNTPSDLTPLTTTTTADIGLKFHYYSGSDRHAFLGRAQDTGYLEWYSDGNDSANVFTGTAYGGIKTGALFLANTGTVLTTSGNLSATAVSAATIGNSGATLTGTISTASQPNITTLAGVTSIGASGVTTSVVGNLSVTGSGGNVTGVSTLFATTINAATIGNTSAAHIGASATLTGTVIATTVNAATIGNSGATLTGTLSTAAQTNITSVGSLGSTQISSLGVGTAASGTSGEIRATNNITAYYSSDAQFKENVQDVPDALSIVTTIGSKLFDWTDAYIAEHGGADGYFIQKSDFGVIAQDVQRVFPQAVRTRPDGSLAVDYEKLGTLAFGAIAQLLARVEALEAKQA